MRRCNMVAKKEILLVDDEEGVRHSWQRFLTQEGHSVATAVDGNRAIDHLSQHRVDLVIADLRMPGPDGLDLLQWIRQESKPIHFILLTGYGTREVEARARSLGAFEYLEKPVAPQVLATVTAAALLEPAPKAAPPPPVEEARAPAPPPVKEARVSEPAPAADAPRPKEESLVVSLATLALAPLMGLAFVVFLPLIGFGLFGYLIASRIRAALRPAR